MGDVQWGDVGTWIAGVGTVSSIGYLYAIRVRDSFRNARAQAGLLVVEARLTERSTDDRTLLEASATNHGDRPLRNTTMYARTTVGTDRLLAVRLVLPPHDRLGPQNYEAAGGEISSDPFDDFGVWLSFDDADGRRWVSKAGKVTRWPKHDKPNLAVNPED